MAERKQCQFQLIRYVPDPVKNEFINIGVLLLASDGGQSGLRFTRDWARVRCLDPDADTEMLEALEIEVGRRLGEQPPDHPRPIRGVLEASWSNGIQITESKAYLAESFVTGLEDLMRLYIDPPKRERRQRRGGRAAIVAVMRNRFEEAGVWSSMLKNIAVARYTRDGDPLRIDCSYRNGGMKMFHAVSLETGVDDAKLLAFSAEKIREGVAREEQRKLLLYAVVEPNPGWGIENEANEQENEKGNREANREANKQAARELSDRYDYASAIMEGESIVVLPTTSLPNIARAARQDLNI